mgnify:CR=1 FL=1
MNEDFSTVADLEEFHSIPPGRYLCHVVEVRPRFRTDGAEQWSIRWQVLEGECAGRLAAWDTLTFSERALSRAKFVLDVLGFDVSGRLRLESSELIGRRAWVSVILEDGPDANGKLHRRTKVPFRGYDRATTA